MLLMFCLTTNVNAVMWVVCSPIADDLEDIYGIGSVYVNMVSLVYMIIFVIIVFPSNYIMDKYGMRVGIIFGAGLTLFGSFIRLGAV